MNQPEKIVFAITVFIFLLPFAYRGENYHRTRWFNIGLCAVGLAVLLSGVLR